MKIYQPMLFVGLGGTGCRSAAESVNSGSFGSGSFVMVMIAVGQVGGGCGSQLAEGVVGDLTSEDGADLVGGAVVHAEPVTAVHPARRLSAHRAHGRPSTGRGIEPNHPVCRDHIINANASPVREQQMNQLARNITQDHERRTSAFPCPTTGSIRPP
jgi:hypothetical protein